MIEWNELPKVEQLASEYYDFYKSVHGIRPRWIYQANENGEAVCCYTEAEMEDMLERLAKEAEVVFAEEKAREEENIAKFEAWISKIIETGAKDRSTALRWIFAEQDDDYMKYDRDYFCFNHGLPYGYLNNEEVV